MKKPQISGGFWLSLLLSMLFNLEWTIPAWILLAMHYWRGWPIKWFWIALAAWVVIIWARMSLLSTLSRWSNEKDPVKENKNPYSVGNRPQDKDN